MFNKWTCSFSKFAKLFYSHHMMSFHHYTMPLALDKHVSARIGQSYDLGSHFLMPELFQMKIFGGFLLCSFTFNSYLGTSWKECSAAMKIANDSVAIQTGCRKDGSKFKRTSWTYPLKTESKNFCWFRLRKYWENICIFWTSNSQWRAAGRKVVF